MELLRLRADGDEEAALRRAAWGDGRCRCRGVKEVLEALGGCSGGGDDSGSGVIVVSALAAVLIKLPLESRDAAASGVAISIG